MDEINNTEHTIEATTDTKMYDNFKCLLFRTVFIVVLALSIIFVKYTNNKIYNKIKKTYDTHVSVNITADYFLNGEKGID